MLHKKNHEKNLKEKLKPDTVVAWASNSTSLTRPRAESLGVKIFFFSKIFCLFAVTWSDRRPCEDLCVRTYAVIFYSTLQKRQYFGTQWYPVQFSAKRRDLQKNMITLIRQGLQWFNPAGFTISYIKRSRNLFITRLVSSVALVIRGLMTAALRRYYKCWLRFWAGAEFCIGLL